MNSDIDILAVAGFVSQYFNVSVKDVMLHDRHLTVALARHVVWYLMWAHTRDSAGSIGRPFDVLHQEVMFAVFRISDKKHKDKLFAAQLADIEKRLRLTESPRRPKISMSYTRKNRKKVTV